MEYIATFTDGHSASTIAHYGIKDMKWGVRRFQNPDGSLTPEGRAHYLKIRDTNNKRRSRLYSSSNILVYKFQSKRARKASRLYREANAKLLDDEVLRKNHGIMSDTEKATLDMAKELGFESYSEAKQFADQNMENYNRVKDSDVVKKYPHDYKYYGHPIFAGGYYNKQLEEDIESKSGSWYFGESVKGSNFESAMKSYQRTKDSFRKANAVRQQNGTGYSWYSSGEKKKAQQKILDAVLKDLGMPVTQANRDAIEPAVFWD